ncbi:centrosomal protein of 19 kDa-like [Stegodyphus dumicola]|uniref:centrosomal protein of 19 kDa-like n=1 Tax=Stegodyphus dumicola TaxID=202533 RepID=UPI0015A98629|nr:centrosomal protein of 19 kDa-like [Stegodyphus dumicola]
MSVNAVNDAIRPLKIGVRFKQPIIVLVYEENSKFRKRMMPVRGLKKNSSVVTAAKELKEHHEKYLKSVPNFKIEKMLRLIQNNMRGLDLEESLQELEKEFSIDPDENLNMADDATLQRKKEIMDLSFEKNRKKPGDPDFQYDIEVDFSSVAGIESSVWDSEKDENELEF